MFLVIQFDCLKEIDIEKVINSTVQISFGMHRLFKYHSIHCWIAKNTRYANTIQLHFLLFPFNVQQTVKLFEPEVDAFDFINFNQIPFEYYPTHFP